MVLSTYPMAESIFFMRPVVEGSKVYFSSRRSRSGSTDLGREWHIDYGGDGLRGVTSEALTFVQMLWELPELIQEELSSPIQLLSETVISVDSWTFIQRILHRNGHNRDVFTLVDLTNANPVFRTGDSSQWNITATCFAPIQTEQRQVYAKVLLNRLGITGQHLHFGTLNVVGVDSVAPLYTGADDYNEIELLTNFWADREAMNRDIRNEFIYSMIGFLPLILSRGYSDVMGFDPLMAAPAVSVSDRQIKFSTTLSRDYSSLQNFLNYACSIPIRVTNGAPVTTELASHLFSEISTGFEMQNYRNKVVHGESSDASSLMFVLSDLAIGKVYENFDYFKYLGQSDRFKEITILLVTLFEDDPGVLPECRTELSLDDILIYLSSLSEIVNGNLLGESLLGHECRKISFQAKRENLDVATFGLNVQGSYPSNGLDLQARLILGEFLKMSFPPKKLNIFDGLIDANISCNVASSWPLGYVDIPAWE